MVTQNIYEYKKVKIIDKKEFFSKEGIDMGALVNKINEVVIEQNHLMKDFELYKKAFKRHLLEDLNEAHNGL